jgi:hypothetical protein
MRVTQKRGGERLTVLDRLDDLVKPKEDSIRKPRLSAHEQDKHRDEE